MGMCKLPNRSQSSLCIYNLGIALLWMKYTSFLPWFSVQPSDLLWSMWCQQAWEAQEVLAQLGLPACTLAKAMRRACPRQQVVQEDERHVEQTQNSPTAWTQAQPNQASPANPQPTYTCMRENVASSHWVGVGSIQHYWSKSWLTQQKYGKVFHKPHRYKFIR